MSNQEKRQPAPEPSAPSNHKIRVGIVGCGEVTQIMHWPSLFQLADRFEVTALCDVSPLVGFRRTWPTMEHQQFSDQLS